MFSDWTPPAEVIVSIERWVRGMDYTSQRLRIAARPPTTDFGCAKKSEVSFTTSMTNLTGEHVADSGLDFSLFAAPRSKARSRNLE